MRACVNISSTILFPRSHKDSILAPPCRLTEAYYLPSPLSNATGTEGPLWLSHSRDYTSNVNVGEVALCGVHMQDEESYMTDWWQELRRSNVATSGVRPSPLPAQEVSL